MSPFQKGSFHHNSTTAFRDAYPRLLLSTSASQRSRSIEVEEAPGHRHLTHFLGGAVVPARACWWSTSVSKDESIDLPRADVNFRLATFMHQSTSTLSMTDCLDLTVAMPAGHVTERISQPLGKTFILFWQRRACCSMDVRYITLGACFQWLAVDHRVYERVHLSTLRNTVLRIKALESTKLGTPELEFSCVFISRLY